MTHVIIARGVISVVETATNVVDTDAAESEGTEIVVAAEV